MNDDYPGDYRLPRLLHFGAIAAVTIILAPLLLGQLVTSVRAGMADPYWPTEPWYLINNYKLDFGYLVEHIHRIAGFLVGGVVSILAIGLWLTERNCWLKWLGLIGLVVLLGAFGQFHRELWAQKEKPVQELVWPVAPAIAVAVSAAIVLLAGIAALLIRSPRAGVRLIGVSTLIAVMIQGLFGGFRVRLNELVGTDLAAVHGIFAQIVFGLVVSLVVLTARPPTEPLPAPGGKAIRKGSIALVVLLFIQIVWGALVRHDPTPLMQRLHFLTAFAALALALWVILKIFTTPAARIRVGLATGFLTLFLTLQLVLGVEAWMARFAQYTLPELVPITPMGAVIRTAHALVGTGLLALAVAIAVQLGQKPTRTVARSHSPQTLTHRVLPGSEFRTPAAAGATLGNDTL